MDKYTPYVVFDSRGSAPVAILTCTRCGACVMAEEDVADGKSSIELHDHWHELIANTFDSLVGERG